MSQPYYDLCSESAINVLELAKASADELKHAYVGAEHVLIGIMAEGENIGYQALKEVGFTLDDAVGDVVRFSLAGGPFATATNDVAWIGRRAEEYNFVRRNEIHHGNFQGSNVQVKKPPQNSPVSPEFVSAMNYAFYYSQYYGDTNVHPEHLLIGVFALDRSVLDQDPLGYRILVRRDIDIQALEERITQLKGGFLEPISLACV